ncbi:MAG TPA: hypothetical protein VMF68_12115 [Spirochaetia bacterium]|nr:hypothetical protein [Spirochaetia bacterium]
MSRSRRIILALVPVAVLASAAAVLLLTVFRPPSATKPELASLLASLDAAISGGNLSTAADLISTVRRFPQGENDQLRLLKRAWQVSAARGNFTLLADLADRLGARGEGSRLKAVAAYADLRAGRVADGLRIVSGAGRARDAAAGLRGEALLRSGAHWPEAPDLVAAVLALEGSSDPSGFARAALRADDDRLALDGALVAMEQGGVKAAAGIVTSQLGEARYDEPAGIILYDAGIFDQSLARLGRRERSAPGTPGLGFLLADVAQAAGDPASAEAFLSRALGAAPSLSWTAYADLAQWSAGRGDLAGGLRRLDDGLAFFPQSRDLLLMKARMLVRAGEPGSAEDVLQRLVSDRPSDVESALLLLSVQGPRLSPEAGRGRLWKIFGQAPEDRLAFDSLCSALASARDWDGLEIAARQHALAGGEPDSRALTLMGFAAAMTGKPEAAISAFRRADQADRDGVARADLALVMIQKGSTSAARAELDAAEDEVRQKAPAAAAGARLSRIETLRAAAFMLDGNVEGASSALARARALDPANLKAALMARKLAGGNQ